jgi:hypothetical protein
MISPEVPPVVDFRKMPWAAVPPALPACKSMLMAAALASDAGFGRMRFDTYIGIGYSNVISLFIIVSTAATDRRPHVRVSHLPTPTVVKEVNEAQS